MKLYSFSSSFLVSLEKKLNPVTGRFGLGVDEAGSPPSTALPTDEGGVMVDLLCITDREFAN